MEKTFTKLEFVPPYQNRNDEQMKILGKWYSPENDLEKLSIIHIKNLSKKKSETNRATR